MKLVYNNDYIDLLSRSENDLLSSLNGLSKERFYFKPSSKEWSVYECLLHILISEKNITKIIKIDSYSNTPLSQKTGMENILAYMEYPERYEAPAMTIPNEANIKNLFENTFDEQKSILDMFQEDKAHEKISGRRSTVKTYDVIFGSKGSRNLKNEKRMFADSFNEFYPEKKKLPAENTDTDSNSQQKIITNPFTAKYFQQPDFEIISKSKSSGKVKNDEEIIEELSSEIFSEKITSRVFSGNAELEQNKSVPLKNIKEMMTLFISIRDELINYFLLNPDVSLNNFYFAHPELGDLTREEWLFYLVAHTNRHRKQIENIKIRMPFAI